MQDYAAHLRLEIQGVGDEPKAAELDLSIAVFRRLVQPRHALPTYTSYILEDPDFGRMAYTVSILLMFSFVILLLMIRSINRSSSTVQIESLLETMRFREELDIQERQRRRLLKAKTKAMAWLSKRNGSDIRGWRSTPALIQQHRTISSTSLEIPRVVVTVAGENRHDRPKSPCLSLLYDFSDARSDSCTPSNGSHSLDIDNPTSPFDLNSQSLSFEY